ncbi:MAG: hypothetical protein ABEL76_04455 [Bradymonadaceae bacterium]
MSTSLPDELVAGINALLVLAAAVALADYTLSVWASPTLPVVVASVGIALPLFVANTAVRAALDTEDELEDLLRAAARVSVPPAVPVIVLAAGWTFSPVRARTLELVEPLDERGTSQSIVSEVASAGLWRSGRDERRLFTALDDPSPRVAVSACRRLVPRARNQREDHLVLTLVDRPALAHACLKGLDRESHAGRIATRLVGQWHRDLVDTDRRRPTDACRLAEDVLTVPARREADILSLLDCALSAPKGRTASCCARRLKKDVGTGAALAHAIDGRIAAPIAADLLPELTVASFNQSQVDRPHAEVAAQLGSTTPDVRRMALQLACSAVDRGGGRNELSHHMTAWLEASPCGAIPPNHLQRAGWWYTCRDIDSEIASSEDLSRTVCKSMSYYLQRRALRETIVRVQLAIAAAERATLGDSIRAGIAATTKAPPIDRARRAASTTARAATGGGGRNPDPDATDQAIQRLDELGAPATQKTMLTNAADTQTDFDPSDLKEISGKMDDIGETDFLEQIDGNGRARFLKGKKKLESFVDDGFDESVMNEIEAARDSMQQVRDFLKSRGDDESGLD